VAIQEISGSPVTVARLRRIRTGFPIMPQHRAEATLKEYIEYVAEVVYMGMKRIVK
jgi:uncharacterized protein (DUF1786 family)